jgi:hypothetical protein
MPPKGTVGISKGFLVEADDLSQPVLCRDVRGFPTAVAASKGQGPPPDRLVFVISDVAMDDWLAQWSIDERHPRRKMVITRRVDGAQLRFAASLLSYGYGVDTAVRIERLEADSRARRAQRPKLDFVEMLEAPPLQLTRRPESARRKGGR